MLLILTYLKWKWVRVWLFLNVSFYCFKSLWFSVIKYFMNINTDVQVHSVVIAAVYAYIIRKK